MLISSRSPKLNSVFHLSVQELKQIKPELLEQFYQRDKRIAFDKRRKAFDKQQTEEKMAS